MTINSITHKWSQDWITKLILEATQSRRISLSKANDEKGRYETKVSDSTLIYFQNVDEVLEDETNFHWGLKKCLVTSKVSIVMSSTNPDLEFL